MTEWVGRKCRWLVLIGTIGAAVAVPALGQASVTGVKALTYDVAAIRPNTSGTGMMRVMGATDRYSATNISLKLLIMNAYNLKTDNLISGLPGWANSARFDIEAKMDGDTLAALKKLPKEEETEQRRLMMQSLLTDRFQLKARRENKELPIYELVVAKGGFKLKDADPNSTYPNGIKGPDGVSHAGMMMIGSGQLTAQAIPMSNLAANLSLQMHRQVVDKTGLTGKYDIKLRWAPDENQGPAMPGGQQETTSMATDSGPSIFTALQEQLGLKLESTKGPVDTIVVDHVEMPSEN